MKVSSIRYIILLLFLIFPFPKRFLNDIFFHIVCNIQICVLKHTYIRTYTVLRCLYHVEYARRYLNSCETRLNIYRHHIYFYAFALNFCCNSNWTNPGTDELPCKIMKKQNSGIDYTMVLNRFRFLCYSLVYVILNNLSHVK